MDESIRLATGISIVKAITGYFNWPPTGSGAFPMEFLTDWPECSRKSRVVIVDFFDYGKAIFRERLGDGGGAVDVYCNGKMGIFTYIKEAGEMEFSGWREAYYSNLLDRLKGRSNILDSMDGQRLIIYDEQYSS